jgi:hypothetical protein
MSFTAVPRGRNALLKQFDSNQVQLGTANEQPAVIRGAGKLALLGRSKWSFQSCGAHDTDAALAAGGRSALHG